MTRPYKWLSQDVLDRIARRYRAGEKMAWIAATEGVSVSTVSRVATINGLRRNREYRRA